MKALSLWEPWASLWCSGVKVHETRSWSTSYRGQLAVHAASRWTKESREQMYRLWPAIEAAGLQSRFAMPKRGPHSLGCIVGVVTLDRCLTTQEQRPLNHLDEIGGDWGPGRWAWAASNPALLAEPLPCRGFQGIWRLPDGITAQILEEVAA